MDKYLENLYSLIGTESKKITSDDILELLGKEENILSCEICFNKKDLRTNQSSSENLIIETIPGIENLEYKLIVRLKNNVTEEDKKNIKITALSLSIPLIKYNLSSTIDTINNRVGLLNELSRLSASNATQDRIHKVIAKDSAYRTKAQGSISIQFSKEDKSLTISGIYGLPLNYIGRSINIENSQITRAIEMGSIISLPDLKNSSENLFLELVKLGFSFCHIAPLILLDEMFGALILLYKNSSTHNENINLILGDISQGSSLALAGCKQREQLSKYTSKLEDLVEERTKELAIQTARADEASLAKSQFVANMSHELRTPLTSIVGFSSLLSEGLLGSLNNQQEEAINSVTKATEYLKDLINDVLDMARVESGKEEANPKKIKLKEVISHTIKLLQQTAKGKNIDLKSEIDDLVFENFLFVDSRHIRQIIINLISNAIKYTPSGGEVRIRAEIVSDKVRIDIVDNGVGISKQDKKKIFQAFDRLENDYSKEQIGTGLGLNLTKRLVELNCGVIQFESNLGEGTTFSIFIPLYSESTENTVIKKVNQEKIGTLTSLNDLNILILDDDLGTLNLIKSLVESLGGRCFKCSDIKSAKETSKNHLIDAYLVDIALRGESGIDFIEYLRKEQRSEPIIVVSGCVFGTHEQDSFNKGADAFLSKPFSSGELSTLIRKKSIEKSMG